VQLAASAKDALALIAKSAPQIILADIKMPGLDGLELQRRVRQIAPDVTFLIMTAYASVETAVQALKEGAYDYIVKPFDPDAVSRLVSKAAERFALMAENKALKEKIDAATPTLVTGGAPNMQAIFSLIDQVGPTDTSVLITGESGTGKELVARRIHAKASALASRGGQLRRFDETLQESELFGAKRCVHGAIARHRKVELARGDAVWTDRDISPGSNRSARDSRQDGARVGGSAP
jgi:DNA-binding NtrC family response regulator